MAYAPTQPVGGRMRFPPPQLGHSTPSPFSPAGMRDERAEFMTPTRQVRSANATSSPFRTSLRHSTYIEAESNANPFTPRVERGVSAGSRTLGRRVTVLNNGTAKGVRISDHGLGSVDGDSAGMEAMNGDFASMGGGVGAWPIDGMHIAGAGSVGGGGGGMDTAIKSPFGSRPKSPGQRSASPRRRTKLPSFLLGSAQLSRSPGKSSTHLPGSELSLTSQNANMFGMASPKAQTPLASNPMSPRRLSGFGSNDMLSSAYTSSMPRNPKGAASALDDAPPVLSLDDMDLEHDDPFVRASDGDADPFANSRGGAGFEASDVRTSSEDGGPSSEKDYNDVKIRSVVVRGLPVETESSALNHFRAFGEILAFAVVSSGGLALLYAQPWQAQRAAGQADTSGRVLIGGRTLASIAWADEASVAVLFTKVFPNQALPRSAAPPAADSFTLAETIYAQSPQTRGARQPLQQPRVGSRLSVVQAADGTGRSGGVSSPFKQNQSLYGRGISNGGDDGGVQATSGTMYSPASVLRVAPTPKPRNGILQSALDILFGW
ncbi:hypothetical protein H4S07_000065 [Coemansia furcata]|uniref:Uncharacterized protein n=1 Tax=Coemansia furcata TaxID=417177 RepID=A0ACC1LT50_9FUNG|nr:hypothetical protein H4S07_000065 [Coemansia furcata]